MRSEKMQSDREKLLNLLDHFRIQAEYDDVIGGLDDLALVGDNHMPLLLYLEHARVSDIFNPVEVTYDRDERRTGNYRQIANPTTRRPASSFRSPCTTSSMASAAPRRRLCTLRHEAAAHVGEQVADRDQRRRDGDVDRTALHQSA
jgi:hypothetical protein